MNPYQQLINSFYTAFNNRDYATMQAAYHADATFEDPVFKQLSCNEVRYMWQMLLTQAKDLKVSCSEVKVTGNMGTCRWDAWYTFSKTGRKVHNIIYATFEFKDDKIVTHRDRFDVWRWSRQALGIMGVLLGWSGFVRQKVQRSARTSLDIYMKSHNLQAAS